LAVRSSIITDAKAKNDVSLNNDIKQISFVKDDNPCFLSQKDAVKDALKEEVRHKAMVGFTS
jgi:hypothetical protein